MILQLKCDGCSAFIVLHASLRGAEEMGVPPREEEATANISTTLNLAEDEVKMLSRALEESGGSFENLFKQYDLQSPTEESSL
jgi:hypothetical protein